MAEETTTTDAVAETPTNGEEAGGGAPSGRAQERIQELLTSNKELRDSTLAAEQRVTEMSQALGTLQGTLEARLPEQPAPEEDEWIDPGEKALKELAKIRTEQQSWQTQQLEKEYLSRVNFEIQQAVGSVEFSDPASAVEDLAREFYAQKGLGQSDKFDANAFAKKLLDKEQASRQRWADGKKQQAEETRSALSGNSPPATTPGDDRPAYGSPELAEWEKRETERIQRQFGLS